MAYKMQFDVSKVTIATMEMAMRFAQHYVNQRTPAGTILLYAGTKMPDYYIPCDGRELNRELHSKIFELYGTKHGGGDGTTTFNIPSLQAPHSDVHYIIYTPSDEELEEQAQRIADEAMERFDKFMSGDRNFDDE